MVPTIQLYHGFFHTEFSGGGGGGGGGYGIFVVPLIISLVQLILPEEGAGGISVRKFSVFEI